ncbi:MBL fold metallo-hydrolase [Oscillospiraceae bacterium LTW-04]|nr:MBL fold metallo-hydrolase [Oscillospiraceae bacterium MB24-C1]
MKTKLTIVAENTVAMPFIPGVTAGLLGEHGLAVLIETETGRWLYDTGRGKALVPNLATLGVPADSIDGVILSHGHLDHVSGLAELLKIRTKPLTIYAHPGIFITRFHKPGDKLKPVGMMLEQTELERMGAIFEFNKGPSMLAPGLWLTGRIPRNSTFETIKEPFFIEEDQGLAPDFIWDEQALVIEGERGLLILSGCAHAGIVNIMSRVKEILPEQKIWGIMGGLHLLNAGRQRLDSTIKALKAEQVEFVSVGHCTGFYETAAIAAALPKAFHSMNTGICFTI